ncbi:MtrAB system histidine kinase MtrB [Nocardioides sp. TF02-7]|uniref:MtrAB system histidine kinase MtrB n=1 Tax=Nocardioides sp. TF02-7 TaxID=2917724 RepID=UPI001F065C63|nr:MtrAB system histidine kinase MtrB [Nocardioides sp. TF02-7]UMG93174.1 MtrAB system histidine kinase MtrB [Nocardioides sp. TF02-7]
MVGSQIQLPADGQTYTLYFLFPLTEEEDTLGLVTRALLTAAGLLLVLVAGLTWLVTRHVVTPVRMARQVAERLASGRLQDRMLVTGEDDLARLAMSFNQMASNLQQQIRQLEELSWVQRRFVSDVSHELRTPLTTVRMAGDVLHDARGDFDPATARAAELLQVELDRFETLLVDLLEISRFDAGAAVLDLEDTNLLDVAHRVVDAARPLAEQRGVVVVVEQPERPVRAEVDVRRVERILRNLVTNAIDHAFPDDPERPIVVRMASDGHAAAITVRDRGVGLSPGESAMVFNRFWRSDPARARSSGGTGLGLAISLEDAHLHGGWLQAWGRPGDGAQFRLTPAPLGRAAVALQPAAAGAGRPAARDRGARRRRPPGRTGRRGARLHGRRRPPGPGSGAVSRRTTAALVAVLVAALLGGCVGLPEEGPVVEARLGTDRDLESASEIDARPPAPGASRVEVVNGFLEAMMAWPVNTSVAREYLSTAAAEEWRPRGTLVYSDLLPYREDGSTVTVRLRDATRLDESGGWQGPAPEPQRSLDFRLTVEDGEFRILDPIDTLVVRATWFQRRYRQVALYYFDATGRVLVPEPVFVPAGDQLATSLVSALVAGPPARLRDVVRTFVPPPPRRRPLRARQRGRRRHRRPPGRARPGLRGRR